MTGLPQAEVGKVSRSVRWAASEMDRPGRHCWHRDPQPAAGRLEPLGLSAQAEAARCGRGWPAAWEHRPPLSSVRTASPHSVRPGPALVPPLIPWFPS